MFTIRSANVSDAPELLSIYAPYVEGSTVSFELAPPSVEEFAARITKVLGGWAWLVAEEDGHCLGYAYASTHRERRAYQWSVETSVYVHADHQGRGVARDLYRALFDHIAQLGYCNAYAGIALPNDASVGLHRSVGFEPIGVFRRVGRKFGVWHDVAWFQRSLREAPLTE